MIGSQQKIQCNYDGISIESISSQYRLRQVIIEDLKICLIFALQPNLSVESGILPPIDLSFNLEIR